MLFNSTVFLFAFLPIVVLGFFLAARCGRRWAMLLLAAGSLFFYGWWNPAFLALLLGSILVNFLAGTHLARCAARRRQDRLALALAVGANLALLGYFKYANFFLAGVRGLLGTDLPAMAVVLPVGISFFTFTQIAFLVDASRGTAREYDLLDYVLFVSYFPHLVAGPILHHREMMPQFADASTYRQSATNAAAGLTIIGIGLFKKVVVADNLAPAADAAFGAAAAGTPLSMSQAWGGALAYTLQLYFDFSGYCDMAIGISLLFGIRLPVNFDSPYKAANIAEFWRRWHMTLSRFLRDYLYVPLGGNRHGTPRQFFNLLVTMLLGGLWHGAGWTFIVWGGLHGFALVAHRTFRATPVASWLDACGAPGRLASVAATFVFVVVAWVFFRADSVDAALAMLAAMFGATDAVSPSGMSRAQQLGLLAALIAVWAFPNSQQIMGRYAVALPVYRPIEPTRGQWPAWRPSLGWLALSLACGWTALYGVLSGRESPYLYFSF